MSFLSDETTWEAREVMNGLRGEAGKFRVIYSPELASTNQTLYEMGAAGAADGTVVIAGHQTSGRGRMRRAFFSPDRTGLYMSLLLRRPIPFSDAVYLTPAAAVATAGAIEALSGEQAKIKWVNDIYINERKVCGILTETAINAADNARSFAFAVIGIGVNITPPCDGFPDAISDVAGVAFRDAQNTENLKFRLAAEILNRLSELLPNLASHAFLAEYRERSMILGHSVTVLRGDTATSALALSIDDRCRLVVRYADGHTEALDSGEVSIKAKRGSREAGN